MKFNTKIFFASIFYSTVSFAGADEQLNRKLHKRSKKTRSPKSNVKCGDVLRHKDFILLEDLECNCERGPGSEYVWFAALTVVGPASLDLNSFSVTCENDKWDVTDFSTIIKVVGRAGVIKNGNISQGNFGIVLGDSGHHTVTNVIVAETANDGLLVDSPFCEVTSSEFVNNGMGFYDLPKLLLECGGNLIDCKFIEEECPAVFEPLNPEAVPCFNGDVSGDAINLGENSQYSVVQGNTISNWGNAGVSSRADFVVIKDNTISINNDEGEPRLTKSGDSVLIQGIANQVIGNIITNSHKAGIDVRFLQVQEETDGKDCDQIYTGGFNIIRSNEVTTSADDNCFKIRTNNNVVVSNTARFSATKSGFNIDRDKEAVKNDCIHGGNDNYIADNVSTSNSESGFKFEKTNNNVIVRNTATGNVKYGLQQEVEEVADEVRGLANILAGNVATGNGLFDFAETGSKSFQNCTQNAYVGNVGPPGSVTDGDPSCTLGEQIDLSLIDYIEQD